MNFKKKVIAHLNKCYSIAPLFYHGSSHFLVAAEKEDPCLLFDMDGHLEDTIWESPGGVMSMVQIPDSNGQFLATWKFYSPNDSADAHIVLASPCANGKWNIQTICALPFVHRFDILTVDTTHYLIACTLKSGHSYKDDWSLPGKVYAAVLPDDMSHFNEKNMLPLTVIQDNMLKNHGYYRVETKQCMSALISSSEGVFQFSPPHSKGAKWRIEHLLNTPASDAAMIDFDGDGMQELITISPFHGAKISIYKQTGNDWNMVYTYEEAEFAHAIWCGEINGQHVAIIGHREGRKALLLFWYDHSAHCYQYKVVDEDCGPSNVTLLKDETHNFLVSANRESNEIAIYQPIL